MLRFTALTKHYGSRALFEGVTQHFDAGCYALMGPNGCGKSTLLAILAGAVPADAGSIEIDGHALDSAPLEAKAALVYIPDTAEAYPFLSGRALLELVASTKHASLTPALALAEQFRLSPHLDKRFEQMSFGTQKKMLLATLAIGTPRVVLADEPSNGLDALTRRVLVQKLIDMGRHAVVVFSTHDPEFAEECGARVLPFDTLGQA